MGSPSTRFIAQTRALAVDQSIKGWITIDGTDGFDPVALVYADGPRSFASASRATGADVRERVRYSSLQVCSIDIDSPCDIPAAFVAPSLIVRSSRRNARVPRALACTYSDRPE